MLRTLIVAVVLTLVGCKTAETPAPAKPVEPAPEPVKAAEPTPPPEKKIELPPAAALPAVPAGLLPIPESKENPLTAEKAELGWKLFYDKRVSKDGSMACAGCHLIPKAFTTENAVDVKVGGAPNKRNSPSVLNLAFHPAWYWDGRAATLEAVSNAAWKAQLGADPAASAAALNAIPEYKAMFERAFGEPATPDNVPKAFASFFRTLNNGNSAWDKFQAGDKKALDADAAEGFKVFAAKGCVTCHVPPLFSTYEFENVGIPGADEGRKDATKADADLGKFKVPSLRNVALTAPYFHDGSVKTLDEAIAVMAKGAKGPGISAKLKAQKLSAKESRQLKLFLESLSGESTYTTEPALP
ncbi:MAG TPA: cytochrome c peroxidase [Archangium sp.]